MIDDQFLKLKFELFENEMQYIEKEMTRLKLDKNTVTCARLLEITCNIRVILELFRWENKLQCGSHGSHFAHRRKP